MTKRTGANTLAKVDPAILAQLNQGLIETATLMEGLAIDFTSLLAASYPDFSAEILAEAARLQGLGITKRMAGAAALIIAVRSYDAYKELQAHPSDTVRGWAAYILAENPALSLADKLQEIQALADDAHFGVREWAWLALRPVIADHLADALPLLTPWTTSPSANLRRFAIEITRPRGVWCKHISVLKATPKLGEPLLHAVMADPSRYVQNSCANWLNDAAKSDANWVKDFCAPYQANQSSAASVYIIRRALRNIA